MSREIENIPLLQNGIFPISSDSLKSGRDLGRYVGYRCSEHKTFFIIIRYILVRLPYHIFLSITPVVHNYYASEQESTICLRCRLAIILSIQTESVYHQVGCKVCVSASCLQSINIMHVFKLATTQLKSFTRVKKSGRTTR